MGKGRKFNIKEAKAYTLVPVTDKYGNKSSKLVPMGDYSDDEWLDGSSDSEGDNNFQEEPWDEEEAFSFPEDGYDYGQHLKSFSTQQDGNVVFIPAPHLVQKKETKERFAVESVGDGIHVRIDGSEDVQEDTYTSEEEQEESLPPDIAYALFHPSDESLEELEDDFMQLADPPSSSPSSPSLSTSPQEPLDDAFSKLYLSYHSEPSISTPLASMHQFEQLLDDYLVKEKHIESGLVPTQSSHLPPTTIPDQPRWTDPSLLDQEEQAWATQFDQEQAERKVEVDVISNASYQSSMAPRYHPHELKPIRTRAWKEKREKRVERPKKEKKVVFIRKRGETGEERRERKRAVKEQQRARRAEKKKVREKFEKEKQRQSKSIAHMGGAYKSSTLPM